MRKQQSGSIITYVLVSIVLAGLLIGGILFSQQRASQVDDRSPATKPPMAPTDVSTNQDQQDKEQKERQAAEQKRAAQQQKQAAEQAQKEAKERELAEQAANAQREASQAPAAAPDGPMARTGGVQPGDLPTTGPVSDALGAVSGLLAIAGAGYVYYHYGRRP